MAITAGGGLGVVVVVTTLDADIWRAGDCVPDLAAEEHADRPTPPRLPPDLTSEPDRRLAGDGEITCLRVQGDFSNRDLDGLHVEDSHIVRSSSTAADLTRLRLTDVVVEGSDFSGADMQEASLTRVAFTDCRMSGALFPRSQMQDVTFSEVKLDEVNFRMIEGEQVLFDHVNSVEATSTQRS
jgi:uncharacterized protein YjbI with pentapeptide repeats